MGLRVLFYVQHLLGVGHVYRATRIAHGLQSAGFETHLLWGGTEIPGFDFNGIDVHRLTPVKTSDASFGKLVHEDGGEFTKQDEQDRAAALQRLFAQISPDILITEAFPFGRRQMLFELLPLLEAAASSANRPMIVSSIRDIMQEGRKQKRVDESVDLVSKYFDLVMVHGDPEFISIEETLQGAGQFQEKIRYTGLVTPNLAASEMTTQKRYDVIASVGGGAFGRELLDCVLDTAGKLADSGGRWLVSAGSELSEVDFRQLANEAPDNIDLVKHIADFASAMMEAEVSISHSGYNTVADILRTGCKSVLYPHTGGRETEQLRRAEKLDQLGYAHMIEPGKLTPGTLGKAIEKARQSSARAISLDLEGASQTAEILHAEYSRWQGNP